MIVLYLDDNAAVHVGEAKVLEPALLLLLLLSKADHVTGTSHNSQKIRHRDTRLEWPESDEAVTKKESVMRLTCMIKGL